MTDNEKCVKRGQALIVKDDPQWHEEVMSANRNKADDRSGTPDRRLRPCGKIDDWLQCGYQQWLEAANNNQTQSRSSLDPSHSNTSLRRPCTMKGWPAALGGWVGVNILPIVHGPASVL